MEDLLQADSQNHHARKADHTDRFIGGKIRHFRKEAGLSLGDLASALGISYQQVQKYEDGKNRISGSRLYMIVILLGRQIGDFFPLSPDQQGDQMSALEGPCDVGRINNPELRSCIKGLVEIIICEQSDPPREGFETGDHTTEQSADPNRE